MKKDLKQFFFALTVVPSAFVLLCSWESPGMYNYVNRVTVYHSVVNDTIPDKQDDFNKGMKDLDAGIKNLNDQINELNTNINTQVQVALSAIDVKAIAKQTEETIKAIDWSAMQQQINNSVQQAQNVIVKVDLKKMQDQMQVLQEKLRNQEFKFQFDNEKLQRQVDEAMKNIEKASQKLQEMKAFTEALEADGLIDQEKGYTIEWKSGELYINNNKQPKDISDKYRKYENTGKIKVLPEDAEHF